MDWLDFDWSFFSTNVVKIAVAFLLTLPIAWEREKSTHFVGLRTFPLVAVASCGYILVAIAILGENADAQARVIQGLMSGIGFIGGGAILKEGANVRGTATAASVWTTGAVGAAAAYGHYEIALLLSLVNYLTLRLLSPIEQWLARRDPGDDDDGT